MGRRGPPPGSGGRPRQPDAEVSHLARTPVPSSAGVLITMRVRPERPCLREPATRRALFEALGAGSDRFGFRLVHFSIQSDHLHLIAEARNRAALSRGLRGLFIRVAKALNRRWGTAGPVWADRYEDRVLRTPAEARAALVFVLNYARACGAHGARGPDPYSSGAWFDGWRDATRPPAPEDEPRPVAAPRTRLLATAWRRARGGRIDADEWTEPPAPDRQPERRCDTRARVSRDG